MLAGCCRPDLSFCDYFLIPQRATGATGNGEFHLHCCIITVHSSRVGGIKAEVALERSDLGIKEYGSSAKTTIIRSSSPHRSADLYEINCYWFCYNRPLASAEIPPLSIHKPE